MKKCFVPHKFDAATQRMVALCNSILDEYTRAGYRVTLRQLYYQLVARGHIENSLRSYKRVGSIVNDARLAGLIDWDYIEDRAREVVIQSHWNSPAEIVEAAARQYRIDKWADQPAHVEVMVEKDALSGVLEPVCRELDIAFTANRGYSSSSAFYEAGRRIMAHAHNGKEIYVLYLGDHDPSGMDMTRDVLERLQMFVGSNVEVNRLALNMNQVEQYNPPENPAKTTDSRAAKYIDEFGVSSWELDALEPTVLAELVRDAVENLRDDDLWQDALRLEETHRKELFKFVGTYNNGADDEDETDD